MNKRQILTALLEILTKHLQSKVPFGKNYENDRALFRGLCNQCLRLTGIDKSFYSLQDELLSIERAEKGVVDVNDLPFANQITLWQGDITRLKADAIVNAANDQYLGCFVPCHNCLDNVIMSASGFQMRDALFKLKEQADYDAQKVKVTPGYNLPCTYVFHVAGPQISGAVSPSDEQHLADCYRHCLAQAKAMKLRSLVFCCLSTGLYAFPNDLAAAIAVTTVKNWLAENDYQIKIIFNVFKDIDQELYEKQLQTTH